MTLSGSGGRKSPRDAITGQPAARTKARGLEPRLPLWSRPGYLVRRLHQINYALWLEELGHAGVTPVQYSILTALAIRGPLDQTTLADEVGIDRTNVAEVLARLDARKLVRRKENPADRRARLATITAKGRALTTGLFPAMQRSQDRLLAALTQKERDLFMRTLVRLIEANNEVGRATLRAD